MHLDAVFWGSIASVAIALTIFIFLMFKIKSLMDRDSHK